MSAPLLATFRSGQGARNVKGELDAAAWRFVLPPVDEVVWTDPGASDRRDVDALRRCVPVRIAAPGGIGEIGIAGHDLVGVAGRGGCIEHGVGHRSRPYANVRPDRPD